MVYSAYSSASHYGVQRYIEEKLAGNDIYKKILTRFRYYSSDRRTIIRGFQDRLWDKEDSLPEVYVEALFRLADDYNFYIQEATISILGLIQDKKYCSRIANKLVEKIFSQTSSYIHAASHISLIQLFDSPEDRVYIDYTKEEEQKREIVTTDNQIITIENLWDCEDEEKFRKTVLKLVEWKTKKKG